MSGKHDEQTCTAIVDKGGSVEETWPYHSRSCPSARKCGTPQCSSDGQPYCHLRLRAPGPRPLQSRPGAQRLPLLPYFQEDTRRAPFTTNKDVEASVRTQDTDFHQQGFFKLVKRWDKCINVGGEYVEK
jgi:hypothetical protein